MNNQEKADEETPKSPIQITVTEDSENVATQQDASESVDNENQIQSDNKDAAPKEKDTDDEREESHTTLKIPGMNIRRRSTLQELDEKHSWLSEIEEKSMNLKTSFVSKAQYVAISNNCQKYLEDLSSDDSMVQFRTKFSKLFENFRTVFIGSQRLLNKVQELTGRDNIAKGENRKLKIHLEDKDRKIEELQEYQNRLQSNVLQVEKEKLALQRLFNECQEKKEEKEPAYNIKENEADTKLDKVENDESQEKINKLEEHLEFLNKELEFTKQRESLYTDKLKQAEDKIIAIQKELSSAKYDLQIQTTRAEIAETSISEKTEDINKKNDIIKTMTEETKQMKKELQTSTKETNRLVKDKRRCQKDLDTHVQTIKKLRKDADIREDRIKMLENQKNAAEVEINAKHFEVHGLKADIANLMKEKNGLIRKVAVLEERCANTETMLESCKKENTAQQKELDLLTKELGESEGKTREFIKQKDVLSEEVSKHEQIVVELRGEIKAEQENYHNVNKAFEKSQKFVANLQDKIKSLEKEKENSVINIAELKKNITNLENEITRFELDKSEMKKTEAKLRQQLDEETVKFKRLTDDERHRKKLFMESKHETERLQNKQTVLEKYVEQLQSVNQGLDERCKLQEAKSKNLTNQLGSMKESYKQEVKNTEELNIKLKHKNDQEQLLLKNVADMENVIVNLNSRIKHLLEEKNVQNSKLIVKEDEINTLKENVRLLQQEVSALDKSVNERTDEVKLLKFEIAEMTRKNALVNMQVDNINTTRLELTSTQKKLTQEKVKSKALEDEVQKPVNVHRWRILEGIDPDKAQLIAKNQALQKQLIQKMKELDQKEVELRENIRQNKQLLEQLRKKSETDFQEQLWACKKELSARIERVKCLTGENNMFQSLCEKYRHENVALKDELRKYKMSEMEARRTKNRKA